MDQGPGWVQIKIKRKIKFDYYLNIDYISYDINPIIITYKLDENFKVWRANYLTYQYNFPNIKFEPFDSQQDNIKIGQLVIADCDWSYPDMEILKKVIIDSDKELGGSNCQVLWTSK